MVSFKCRPFAFYRKPGDVIAIQDNRRSRSRLGGLIKSATTSAIVPDSPVTLIGSPPFSLKITLPNLVVEERYLVNGVGTHVILYPTVPFSAVPLAHANWIVKDGAAIERLYRVLSVSPGQGTSQLMYEISCKRYAG
jgi:predicted phage tail protein